MRTLGSGGSKDGTYTAGQLDKDTGRVIESDELVRADEGIRESTIEKLASLKPFSEAHLTFLDQLTESIGVVLNTLGANMRTEELLVQSQSLTDELRRTNEELQDKAHLLVKQKEEVEAKNKEVEEARRSLEEKMAKMRSPSRRWLITSLRVHFPAA